MLPFTRQILIACDGPKNGMARISGVEAPKFEDNEATFPELKARIQKTLDYLDSVPAEKVDGTEDKDITFPIGRDKTRTMKAEAYLKHWVLPNFYFHITTAYAILRHNGVELGKADYLAGAKVVAASLAALDLAGCCFECGQPVKLGADVGHAAGDDHAPGA